MVAVVIGMDPHKRSATIEVLDGREKVLSTGRFGNDREGYRDLLGGGAGLAGRHRSASAAPTLP